MEFVESFDPITNTITSLSRTFDGIMVFTPNYNSYPIYRIGDDACSNGKLTGLDLSSTNIEYIGSNSFLYCRNLSTILFPVSLISIGSLSFALSAVVSIHITINIMHMPGSVWNQSPNILFFTVDENNQYFSAASGFLFSKSKDILVCVPRNVTSSDDIPYFGLVNIIGGFSLTFVNIISFIAPPSVQGLQYCSFHGLFQVKEIDLSATSITVIPTMCFWSVSAIEIKLPTTLEKLEVESFYNTYSIKSLILSFGISTIENRALSQCNSLRHIYYFGRTNFANTDVFDTITASNSLNIFVTDEYKSDLFAYKPITRHWYQKCGSLTKYRTSSPQLFISSMLFHLLSTP